MQECHCSTCCQGLHTARADPPPLALHPCMCMQPECQGQGMHPHLGMLWALPIQACMLGPACPPLGPLACIRRLWGHKAFLAEALAPLDAAAESGPLEPELAAFETGPAQRSDQHFVRFCCRGSVADVPCSI